MHDAYVFALSISIEIDIERAAWQLRVDMNGENEKELLIESLRVQ